MSTFNSRSNFSDNSESECGLDIKHRKSFPVTYENSSNRGYKIKTEDFGSSPSESTSSGSSVTPMSMTESSVGGESMFYNTNPTAPITAAYVYQMPQGYFRSVTGQVQQANVVHATMGIPVGYPQLQGHQTLTNIQHSQPLQPQTVVYPMQQCQVRAQDWARIPKSTNAVPVMMRPVSFPTSNFSETHQVSSVSSSAMSTPVFSFSPTSYVNSYGYVSTPSLSSASCTPVPYQTAIGEVPPAFNLHKSNMEGCSIPQGLSCNINMSPIADGCRRAQEKSESPAVETGSLPVNQFESLKVRSASRLVEEGAPEKDEEDTKEVEDLWSGNVNYAEYQENGCSNLFVRWTGTKAELDAKMRSYNLQVRDIYSTVDKSICNVIFESHPIARKAFTMQKQIGLRIVPPKNSHRIWLRNPSPNFIVKFETKCRLVVRKGKAECHDIVGELLEGCIICADQLKGHRIRVVCCEGSFKFPGGKIVQMKGLPSSSDEKTSLGWISYRCKYTKELLVIRKSWNKLGDYIFKGQRAV